MHGELQKKRILSWKLDKWGFMNTFRGAANEANWENAIHALREPKMSSSWNLPVMLKRLRSQVSHLNL